MSEAGAVERQKRAVLCVDAHAPALHDLSDSCETNFDLGGERRETGAVGGCGGEGEFVVVARR